MNTIIVMFDGTCKNKYAYNTDSKVATGDILVSPYYSNSKMTVIDVLDESYKYVNPDTGELSNKMTYLNQNLIKTLKVVADKADQTILCIRLIK
jgi:hypothetical protein